MRDTIDGLQFERNLQAAKTPQKVQAASTQSNPRMSIAAQLREQRYPKRAYTYVQAIVDRQALADGDGPLAITFRSTTIYASSVDSAYVLGQRHFDGLVPTFAMPRLLGAVVVNDYIVE